MVAVLVGILLVNGPVLVLLVGPSFLAVRSGQERFWPATLALSLVAAWSWWSFSVPRWRLWAYERVQSTGALQWWALATGLVWPRGSVFERTEFKSASHRQRELDLERRYP